MVMQSSARDCPTCHVNAKTCRPDGHICLFRDSLAVMGFGSYGLVTLKWIPNRIDEYSNLTLI